MMARDHEQMMLTNWLFGHGGDGTWTSNGTNPCSQTARGSLNVIAMLLLWLLLDERDETAAVFKCVGVVDKGTFKSEVDDIDMVSCLGGHVATVA